MPDLLRDRYDLKTYVYIFDTPVSSYPVAVPGKPNGFGSYVQAWDWIEANRDALQLPPGASAVEVYVPRSK